MKSRWASITTMSPSSKRCLGLYQEVAAALRSEYGLDIDISELPLLLAFGSWIGGDRDGNPFVTPEVTREAIGDARARLLSYYDQQVQLIIDLLTTSAQQLPVSSELRAQLDSYLNQLQTGVTQIFGGHFQFEFYRRFLVCVHARLLRTAGQHTADTESLEASLTTLPAYRSAEEFQRRSRNPAAQPG